MNRVLMPVLAVAALIVMSSVSEAGIFRRGCRGGNCYAGPVVMQAQPMPAAPAPAAPEAPVAPEAPSPSDVTQAAPAPVVATAYQPQVRWARRGLFRRWR